LRGCWLFVLFSTTSAAEYGSRLKAGTTAYFTA
jgi:hypothetical protein